MKRAAEKSIICIVLAGILLIGGCGRREGEKQPGVATLGYKAPGFTLVDTQGKTWNLSELKGQVVFVNFWATWCPPCRQELPSMQELFMTIPGDKFKMLSILSNDEPEFAEKLAGNIGCSFPIMDDPDGSVAGAYGITGVPETFIIDKEGVLREKFIGPMNWSSSEAKQMLYQYIKQ